MIKNCYVYVISEAYTERLRGRCAVKIGLAVDPLRRVKELQTGNARRLWLNISIGPMSEKRAARFEKHLHKRFKKWRLVGEWFNPLIMSMLSHNIDDGRYDGDIQLFNSPPNPGEQREHQAQKDLDRICVMHAVKAQ